MRLEASLEVLSEEASRIGRPGDGRPDAVSALRAVSASRAGRQLPEKKSSRLSSCPQPCRRRKSTSGAFVGKVVAAYVDDR